MRPITLAHWICANIMLAVAPSYGAPPVTEVVAKAPAFHRLIADGANLDVVADGLTWAEGPVWVQKGGYLLVSDVPKNRMYRWAPGSTGASVFLEPSGGLNVKGFREAGSNGLKAAQPGSILVADSGSRAVALLDLQTKTKHFLAQNYQGRKLNSPNDLAVGPDGAIWFTDPPYGLEGINESPLKEQSANRVYRLDSNRLLTAIESELTFPNGIAFSPDGRTLYVSNSDPKHAVILAWHVGPDGTVSGRHMFTDMTALVADERPGLPDGMCVDEKGNLWATGPGGIHVLSPDGHELGLVSTGAAISNCTFGGPDGRTLFMTSTHQVVMLRTNVHGAPVRLPHVSR